jgi:hypothetical protein
MVSLNELLFMFFGSLSLFFQCTHDRHVLSTQAVRYGSLEIDLGSRMIMTSFHLYNPGKQDTVARCGLLRLVEPYAAPML